MHETVHNLKYNNVNNNQPRKEIVCKMICKCNHNQTGYKCMRIVYKNIINL